MVAHRKTLDIFAERLDDTGTLVAQDHRERRGVHPFQRVEVRSADPARGERDLHLTGARPVQLHLGELEGLAVLVKHCTQHVAHALSTSRAATLP